ncbi:MAG: hypothetical protein QN173_08310 [Armatimonadota bacterium]|nr:hypothetical protein [Armatimonadota bacterium]MDR7401606.1 hypothetical protein [Armatimonadota bacterium]MDR7405005.1 hypothetical protein [Armatimonadota bacterium]MDR7436871.1 hypothetical protein [Armatimonadota bacterium]MDR7471588.1 hypothetical protein [Armatimonadota bacterium]
MDLRYLYARLADPEGFAAAARGLLAACALGYGVTLLTLIGRGAGLQRWFFWLLVWVALAYVPLRILLEAARTGAEGARRHLVARAAAHPDRYRSRRSLELVVDGLFARHVVLPRIATPVQGRQARDAAVAILARASEVALVRATTRCLATVDAWVADLAQWSARHAPANIQARWADVRALAGLAALTRILVAACEDQSGRPFAAGPLDSREVAAYLDACLDFCDRLALEVDVIPWTEPMPVVAVEGVVRERTRDAWRAFSAALPPARQARVAFVDTLLGGAA